MKDREQEELDYKASRALQVQDPPIVEGLIAWACILGIIGIVIYYFFG